MTKIHGLNGQPLESEAAEKERQEEAIRQFEAMMKELEEARLPLADLSNRDAYIEDISKRIDLIGKVVNMTYSQPLYKRSGNPTQGFNTEITGVVDVSLLDNRQIALLALRAYELIKTL